MKWTLALASAAMLLAGPRAIQKPSTVIQKPSTVVRDIDGVKREPMHVTSGHAEALFFVTEDCPVSNYYSREIRRICEDYAHKGLGCSLVYADPATTDEKARKHAAEYQHGNYPKLVDRDHALVDATGAAITPTVVVIRSDETIAYRGRIDNFFAAISKSRQVVTERN